MLIQVTDIVENSANHVLRNKAK